MVSATGAVLVVDDDEDVCEMLALALSTLGAAEVLALRSMAAVEAQAEAVAACRLAILDINLGAGAPSGIDVYHWLHARGFAGKIVFLTGHAAADPRVVAASELTGAEIHSKPMPFAKLSALLRETGETGETG